LRRTSRSGLWGLERRVFSALAKFEFSGHVIAQSPLMNLWNSKIIKNAFNINGLHGG
jgi:hypothetical protein